MHFPSDQRRASLLRGRILKRRNAAAALLCGALPGTLLLLHGAIGWAVALAGLLTGLVYANGFEYFYHRFLLHRPRSDFGREHLKHHGSVGQEDEAEHLTFGSSPRWIVALFAVNGIPLVALDALLGTGIAGGMLLGFAVYFVLLEEVHWRIHLGTWLPPFLLAARPYHLAHHDVPEGRYNVFFPLFDCIFGDAAPAPAAHPAPLQWRRGLGTAMREYFGLACCLVFAAIVLRPQGSLRRTLLGD